MKKNQKISSYTIRSALIIQVAPKQRSTSSTARRRPSSPYYSIYMALKFVVYFIIPLVLSCFVATVDSSCDQRDQESLLAFSQHLTVSSPCHPLNWTGSVDCCSWEGIFCAEDKDNGDWRVINVSLPSRGLSGSISPYLSNLTGLLQLNLSHNRLYGNLPIHFFSLLNHLKSLDLSNNWLFGELPKVVDNYNNSTIAINGVDLSSNLFHGVIPSSFLHQLGIAAARGSLTYFNVSNNSFTGQIPISLLCINENNSSSLTYLDFSYNKYDGQIPYGIGACSKLESFRAGSNSLIGSLPNDIYDAISLTTLELFANQLVGRIPLTIGKLSKLEHLLLHTNNLTGTLPQSLRNCVNLVNLNLRFNFLEGNLSDFNFSGFRKLTTLDLANNSFIGKLPPTLFSCKSLVAVRLSSNQLEGEISPDILGLQSLSFLSISNNKLRNFTGAMRILTRLKNLTLLFLSLNFYEEVMPNDENLLDQDDLQNLRVLTLSSCNFTGSIPRWLANFQKLQFLRLSYNRLNGSIPAWLGTFSQLFYLDLSYNFFTGILPPELARLPALSSQQAINKIDRIHLELPVFFSGHSNPWEQQYNQLANFPPAIYLGNNRLNGSIPIQIAQLKSIHHLDLSYNYFSGNIPVQLSNLSNLEDLNLSRNHLSGEIPVSLKSLTFLSFFSVANNNLQGEIPTGGQFDTFPPSSFEGNPRLCGLVINRPCPSQQEQRGSPTPTSNHPNSNKSLHIGLGFAIGFGIFFNLIVYILWPRSNGLLRRYFSRWIVFM